MDGHNLDWTRDLPGKMAERWPKDEQGNFVEAAYIPYVKKYPHYGGFGNLMLGISAEGVDIFVPATMLEDAKNILEGEAEDEEEL